ncbi:hypothetical protein E4T47_08373 [Aureobasidium subglaciale]|nr:hypothetical protein E4T47_08373 [Aureobasidium subglaciale]
MSGVHLENYTPLLASILLVTSIFIFLLPLSPSFLALFVSLLYLSFDLILILPRRLILKAPSDYAEDSPGALLVYHMSEVEARSFSDPLTEQSVIILPIYYVYNDP